jgi:hypothetical protein
MYQSEASDSTHMPKPINTTYITLKTSNIQHMLGWQNESDFKTAKDKTDCKLLGMYTH